MKTRIALLLFVVFSLFFLSSFNPAVIKKLVSQNQIVSEVSQELPVRLKIPTINIDAPIEYVGLTPLRAMEVPKDSLNVGWYKLGPRPGEVGSAVIDGHVDRENGEPGVFANLYKLKAGDKVYIEDDKGKILTFIVRKSQTFDPGLADGEVFARTDGIHLNLITCDGVWDGTKKSYSKRLVVFADIEIKN